VLHTSSPQTSALHLLLFPPWVCQAKQSPIVCFTSCAFMTVVLLLSCSDAVHSMHWRLPSSLQPPPARIYNMP
jgi:hypothetical protein